MSFLEKLHKNTQANDTSNDEITPQDGTAIFVAYKASDQTKKVITADNINEIANENEILQEKPTTKIPTKKIISSKKNDAQAKKDGGGWFGNEGQLVVSVYQTNSDLVLQSAIAGVKVEDLDVLIEDEVITIKGNRVNPLNENGDYFIEECYWGPFSRKVILPVEVDSGRADATMKDGILTIRIPKIIHEKKKKLIIKE